MPVSQTFRELALDQLGRCTRGLKSRSMFGGVGIYAGSLFFALLAEDRLYLKTDETSRPDYEARGWPAFFPFGDASKPMHYHEVPLEVIENAGELQPWVDQALAVAQRAARGKKVPAKMRRS